MAKAKTAKAESAQGTSPVLKPPAAEPRPKRQLVVVVHGVGVKEAGVSADLLATALEDVPDSHGDASLRSYAGVTLRPHSSDDFHLRELEIYNVDGKRQVFPARIRRYRSNDETTGKLRAERVVADFYWGDISNIASGVSGLFLGILKTILGLSHAVRESALSVFPGTGWNAFVRKLANFSALTIHGPIAAVNVVLILGALLNAYLARYLGWAVWIPAWLTVVAALVGGFVIARLSPVYLTRWFALWTAGVGVLLAIFLFFLPVDPKTGTAQPQLAALSVEDTDLVIDATPHILNGAEIALLAHVCRTPSLSGATLSVPCVKAYDSFFIQGLRILGLMGLAWVAVVIANAIVMAAECARAYRATRGIPPTLVSASIALMSMLWIIMIASVWAALVKLPFSPLPSDLRLESILGTAMFAVIYLALIAIAAGAVYLMTGRWAAAAGPESYIRPGEPDHARRIANRNRLIIARWMLIPIWLFFIAMLLTTVAGFLPMLGFDFSAPGLASRVNFELQRNFATVMAGLALLGGILFAAGQQQLRAGLGIAIDVITWLNDHSWNSVAAGTLETRMPTESVMPGLLAAKQGQKAQGYWRRERIKNRLKVLMEKLIRDEKPDEVVFISHSQGTVVAIDVLSEMATAWRADLGEGGKVKLVTMGSPYVHVHCNYFPASFPRIDEMAALRPVGEEGGNLDDWINIFRIDDFVGTFIDPVGQWPREYPVKANGHTSYWVDENVFPILKAFVS